MKRMAWIFVVLAPMAAMAQPQAGPTTLPARQAPVEAASHDALATLHKDILAFPLTGSVTIGDLVPVRSELGKVMEQARQIGGPRWLDEQTAQVRMEIEGRVVAAIVREVAVAQPQQFPVPLSELEPALMELAERTFTATGSGTTAATIEQVRPLRLGRAWDGVDEEARRAAVRAAKYDAVLSVIESAGDIRLPSGQRLGEILRERHSPLRRQLEAHLMSRPVTAVRFGDDRQVEVTLSAPPVETFEVIRAALSEMPHGRNLTEDQWASIREQFLVDINAATGHGAVPTTAMALPIQPTVQLPTQPPVWTEEMIDAEGMSIAVDTKLKTARAAEQQAIDKLRQQILDLPLTPELTIGQAAQRDPELAEAVDRALRRSRTYKSDYHADGRVVVRTSLELRDLWEQLSQR